MMMQCTKMINKFKFYFHKTLLHSLSKRLIIILICLLFSVNKPKFCSILDDKGKVTIDFFNQ